MTDESQNPSENPSLPEIPLVDPIEAGKPESTKTAPLPVRIPTDLLSRIDQECQQRGIVRSELVRQILTDYYQKPGSAPIANLELVMQQQQTHIDQLKRENEQLQQQVTQARALASKDKPESASSNYVAELENDLLTAVGIACKGIMCTRSDFRKKTKHYGKLEHSRTN